MKCKWALLSMLVALTGCKMPMTKNLPPAEMMMHPGPGVDGPGPGVMMMGAEDPYSMPMPAARSQVAFTNPEGLMIAYDVGGIGAFDSEAIVAPAKVNFDQGAIYRLKLTNIPGREGVELYPTLEIAPSTPRIDAFLAHNSVPCTFTEEDFDQVQSGNFVTKVIYLPDPEFQQLAIAGADTLVSTKLDPGMDPIVEADNRGAILAIVRMGDKDLEIPGEDEMMGAGGEAEMAMYGEACDEGGLPPDFVAGVTAPMYGMPMSGTPIGLPGPPHIPLGVPAGLQKHVIRNHTHTHLPKPTKAVRIHVKQSPGIGYPRPASRAFIHERAIPPMNQFHPPVASEHQSVMGGAGENCDENCEQ